MCNRCPLDIGCAYVVFDIRRQDWKPKDGSPPVEQFTVKTETPVLPATPDEYRFFPTSWKKPAVSFDEKFVDKTFVVSITSSSPCDARKEYVVVDFRDDKGEVTARNLRPY